MRDSEAELRVKLEGLADEWEDSADDVLEDLEHGEYHEGYNDGRRHSAKELRGVLTTHDE